MREIYCHVCENCTKQCEFSQYDIERSKVPGNNANGEIITWKCKNFEPIFVSDRGLPCHINDVFFKSHKKSYS